MSPRASRLSLDVCAANTASAAGLLLLVMLATGCGPSRQQSCDELAKLYGATSASITVNLKDNDYTRASQVFLEAQKKAEAIQPKDDDLKASAKDYAAKYAALSVAMKDRGAAEATKDTAKKTATFRTLEARNDDLSKVQLNRIAICAKK